MTHQINVPLFPSRHPIHWPFCPKLIIDGRRSIVYLTELVHWILIIIHGRDIGPVSRDTFFRHSRYIYIVLSLATIRLSLLFAILALS